MLHGRGIFAHFGAAELACTRLRPQRKDASLGGLGRASQVLKNCAGPYAVSSAGELVLLGKRNSMSNQSKKKNAHDTATQKKSKGVVYGRDSDEKLGNKKYEAEMFKLQTELVKLQEWAKVTGARVVILFEGRDAAGKGGIIKRIAELTSPRVFRVVALPAPTERQKTQIYLQRYIEHLPAGGEVVIFDRSWYNRAGVEHVMGFCSKEAYGKFLKNCPRFRGLPRQ